MALHDDLDARRAADSARKREVRDQKERDEAVRSLLKHPHGRRYLWWLLEITGAIGRNPFTNDPYQTAFACGEQNIGLQVMAHITEASPDGFVRLITERQTDEDVAE